MQRPRAYLKRWAWLLILCPLLAGGATLALALVRPPTHEATATLVFGLTNPRNHVSLSPDAAARLGDTYVRMLQSPAVLQAAAAQLGLHETPEQLASQVHASYQSGSTIITLTADASDSALAIRLANAVVNAFRQVAQQVSPPGKDVVPWGSAQMNPVKLKGITFSTAGMALALALLVALSVVALLYFLDDSIFTLDEVATAAEVPVLGIPFPMAARSSLKHITNHHEADEEAHLLLEAVQASVTWPATIFCAWATARERAPHQVMRLAQAAAHAGLRVLVINTDGRYQWLQDLYGISEARGLEDALLTGHSLEPYIISLATPGLAVVPSGLSPKQENAALLSPLTFAQLLAPLRQHADLILVTGAPILADAAAALTRAADGVMVMAPLQRTRRRDLHKALAALRHAHTRVLGVVCDAAHKQPKPGKQHSTPEPIMREAGKAVIVKERQEAD